MNPLLSITVVFGLVLALPIVDAESGHEGHDEEQGHDEGIITMNQSEREAQGIEIAQAGRRSLTDIIIAPGEVVINAYRSAQVTPRISAQIMHRHARLGNQIDEGELLVVLSSVEMADAQGALVVADREWQRVKSLGRKVVSERRYVEARVARQLAYAKVQAYGMTESQISTLLKQGDASKTTGAFDLVSPQNGTVISDDFVVGEVVEPGRILFEITDESILWVEAKLSPEDVPHVETDSIVHINVNEQHRTTGRVIQRYHRLDETTRTQSVRIEIDNRDHHLHPGQFVAVTLQTGMGKEALAVPKASLVLMEGSPTLFKLEGDELHPHTVETGVTHGNWTEIRSGLTIGDEIVVKGAFVLKSLLLKSRMGEGHVH